MISRRIRKTNSIECLTLIDVSETQLTQKCTTNIVNYAKRILKKLKQNEITIEQVE